MADSDRRALARLAAQGDPQAQARLDAMGARAGKLPRHSWAHQRDRLMRILSEMVRDGNGDIYWADDYAPGSGEGSAPHGVIAANWNDGEPFHRIGELFERLPSSERPEMDWSDCVSNCGGCCKMIRTEPTCWSWEPGFIVTDGDIYCEDCADPRSLIEDRESGYSRSRGPLYLPDWAVEQAQGFRLYDD